MEVIVWIAERTETVRTASDAAKITINILRATIALLAIVTRLVINQFINIYLIISLNDST